MHGLNLMRIVKIEYGKINNRRTEESDKFYSRYFYFTDEKGNEFTVTIFADSEDSLKIRTRK